MCGKKSLLFLAFCLVLLSGGLCYSAPLDEAKTLIKELMTINEKLENQLIERDKELDDKDQQLSDKNRQLTELSTLLEVIKIEQTRIKSENLILSTESSLMKNLLTNREQLEKERENLLTILEITTAFFAVGWSVDRIFIR